MKFFVLFYAYGRYIFESDFNSLDLMFKMNNKYVEIMVLNIRRHVDISIDTYMYL